MWRQVAALAAAAALMLTNAAAQQPSGARQIDLSERFKANGLRAVNRKVESGTAERRAVRVGEQPGPGVVWIDGTDFATGTIELEVKGRDVPQASFVGVAFHRQDDDTYEAVYLRPFNFRVDDPVRKQNAVQYMSVPDYDWPRLRKEFPGEFENPVSPAVDPTGWVPLRIVVTAKQVQVFVGPDTTPTLEVRRMGTAANGAVGLWVGNNSDGEFANLRITPAR